jgi:hypothetical protein
MGHPALVEVEDAHLQELSWREPCRPTRRVVDVDEAAGHISDENRDKRLLEERPIERLRVPQLLFMMFAFGDIPQKTDEGGPLGPVQS